MKYTTILLLPIVLLSCWPKSISFQDGSMPDEWKSFTVKTLELIAPNAPTSLGPELSEKIKDGIQNRTKLVLNSTVGAGEISIEGVINNFSITPIALQPGDNAAKNRLTVSANFTIFISQPKEEKMSLTSSRFVDYDSNTDFSSVEKDLLDDINNQIVQDVINKLFSNW